jgi:hypothetical protein
MPIILIVPCSRISVIRSRRRSSAHLYITHSPTEQSNEITHRFLRRSRKYSKARRWANGRRSCLGQYGVTTPRSVEPPTSSCSGYCSDPKQYYQKKSSTNACIQQRRHHHAIDVSYAAPQAHEIVNVALHREYSPGIVFIFCKGRKDLYHV